MANKNTEVTIRCKCINSLSAGVTYMVKSGCWNSIWKFKLRFKSPGFWHQLGGLWSEEWDNKVFGSAWAVGQVVWFGRFFNSFSGPWTWRQVLEDWICKFKIRLWFWNWLGKWPKYLVKITDLALLILRSWRVLVKSWGTWICRPVEIQFSGEFSGFTRFFDGSVWNVKSKQIA